VNAASRFQFGAGVLDAGAPFTIGHKLRHRFIVGRFNDEQNHRGQMSSTRSSVPLRIALLSRAICLACPVISSGMCDPAPIGGIDTRIANYRLPCPDPGAARQKDVRDRAAPGQQERNGTWRVGQTAGRPPFPPCSAGYPGRSREWLRPCLFARCATERRRRRVISTSRFFSSARQNFTATGYGCEPYHTDPV
jgi:hypothetical protein